MEIALYNTTEHNLKEEELEKIVQGCLQFVEFEVGELSVALVSSHEMRNLNKTYLKMDKPTDVLSFDYGEIVLCPDYIKEKYHLQKTDEVHCKLCELFIHGLVHIAGFHHANERQLKRMQAIEEKIQKWYHKTI